MKNYSFLQEFMVTPVYMPNSNSGLAGAGVGALFLIGSYLFHKHFVIKQKFQKELKIELMNCNEDKLKKNLHFILNFLKDVENKPKKYDKKYAKRFLNCKEDVIKALKSKNKDIMIDTLITCTNKGHIIYPISQKIGDKIDSPTMKKIAPYLGFFGSAAIISAGGLIGDNIN